MSVKMQGSNIKDAVESLGRIARTYPAISAEADVLRLAAYALLYIDKEKLVISLSQFIVEENAPLNDEQRANLERMGIEP